MSSAWTAPPAELSAALEALLEGLPRAELQQRSLLISQGFRARKPSRDVIRDDKDALAYALTRLPATYAAVADVLRRLDEEVSNFSPLSIIDAGCGLASAAFAALEAWPQIADVTLVDRSPEFLSLAQRLTRESRHPALAQARLIAANLRAPPSGPPADLVVASYALTEIDEADLPRVVDALWMRAGRALMLIEPGTPRDFARLRALRMRLIEAGASIALPCPHDRLCPMASPDWCHFAIRLPRSRSHRLLKGAEAPFEDEKFSYLVAMRDAEPQRRSRVIAPPRQSKWGMDLRLCGPDGIDPITVAKRDKAFFHIMRKSAWGDSTPAPEKA